MLQMIIRINRSEAATLTVGEQPLAPTPAVLKMRRRALEIVAALLKHPFPSFRRAGADLFGAHAHGEGAMVSSKAMLPSLERELGELEPTLERVLVAPIDHEVRHTLIKDLFFLWATDRPGGQVAGRLLRGMPTPLAYKAYSFVAAPWEWRFDLQAVIDEAPATDRWTWWVHKSQSTPIADVNKLLDELDASVLTPDQLVELVGSLPRSERAFLLLDDWCDRSPEKFREAAERASDVEVKSILDRTRARWRRRADPRTAIDDLRAAVAGADGDAVSRLMSEARTAPRGVAVELVRVLVEVEDIGQRSMALDLLRALPGVDDKDLTTLCMRALRDGIWARHFDVVWSIVDRLCVDQILGDAELSNLVKARLTEAAQKMEVRHGDWHVEHLIDAVIPEEDPQGRLSFVGELLPSGDSGVIETCLGPFIASEEGVQMLLQACREWIEQGKLNGASGCVDLIDRASGRGGVPVYISTAAFKLAGSSDKLQQDIGLHLLSLCRDDAAACAKIADAAAAESPSTPNARQLLARFSMPRGVYSRSFGKSSPAMLDLKATLESAQAKVTVIGAADLIREVLGYVERAIENELRRDEELKDPR